MGIPSPLSQVKIKHCHPPHIKVCILQLHTSDQTFCLRLALQFTASRVDNFCSRACQAPVALWRPNSSDSATACSTYPVKLHRRKCRLYRKYIGYTIKLKVIQITAPSFSQSDFSFHQQQIASNDLLTIYFAHSDWNSDLRMGPNYPTP